MVCVIYGQMIKWETFVFPYSICDQSYCLTSSLGKWTVRNQPEVKELYPTQQNI